MSKAALMARDLWSPGSASKPVSRILSSRLAGSGDHSSSPGIAAEVERPTRELPRRKVGLGGAGHPYSPIWSCSVWGLPCPRYHYRGGALLLCRRATNQPRVTRAPKRPAPFHPYPSAGGRYVFCGTFRIVGVRPGPPGIRPRPSLLASTLPCGVRTFLSPTPASRPRIPRPARGKRSALR